MTKPRPRRQRSGPEIDEVSWRFVCDATTEEDRREQYWLLYTLEFDLKEIPPAIVAPPTGKSTSELWAEFGDDVLAWWIKEKPRH